MTHVPNGNRDDRVLLAGPQSRRRDLWLVLRTMMDFVRGFRRLHFVGPCVTVFGSARFTEDHPYYALGREVGAGLARLGFTVMTGGGAGLLRSAESGLLHRERGAEGRQGRGGRRGPRAGHRQAERNGAQAGAESGGILVHKRLRWKLVGQINPLSLQSARKAPAFATNPSAPESFGTAWA